MTFHAVTGNLLWSHSARIATSAASTDAPNQALECLSPPRAGRGARGPAEGVAAGRPDAAEPGVFRPAGMHRLPAAPAKGARGSHPHSEPDLRRPAHRQGH